MGSEELRSKHILVVDDDPQSRIGLRQLLECEGYEVITATNGVEALAAAATHAPDVVVSDVQMPVMDGLTLLARLEVQNPRLPVVLMSADHDAVIAAAAHAWPFVPKPVAFDDLLRVVEAVSVDRNAA
jgi:CheY-like chemotaxis protein